MSKIKKRVYNARSGELWIEHNGPRKKVGDVLEIKPSCWNAVMLLVRWTSELMDDQPKREDRMLMPYGEFKTHWVDVFIQTADPSVWYLIVLPPWKFGEILERRQEELSRFPRRGISTEL